MRHTNGALSQSFIESLLLWFGTSDFAVYAEGNLLIAPYDKQWGSGDYFIPEFQLPQRQHTDNTKKVESTKIQCLSSILRFAHIFGQIFYFPNSASYFISSYKFRFYNAY